MKAVLLASSLVMAASAAFAADAVVYEQPPEAVTSTFDWSGVYVGGLVGYAWGDQKFFDDTVFDSGEQDLDGAYGGLTVGYNWQMGWGLLGVEADISYADISGDFDDQPSWGCGSTVDGCVTEIDWFGTARVRAGMPMGRFLPFITGGVAVARIESDIVGDSDFSLDETQVGWTAGGGLEFALNEQWSVKGEYLFVDLGSAEDSGSPSDFEVEAEFSTVRLGVNYSF